MKKIYFVCAAAVVVSALFCNNSFCQTANDSTGKFIKIAAGPEYKRSGLYKSLWGRNYRKEWTTPVTFPITQLDTLKGGIASYKEGGSHQSSSLHIKTKDGKEYALRSVDKSLSKLVPDIFHHTFIEHIANDEISMSHPYGALGVPIMAQAAGIPHTTPQYLYIPKQNGLDSFNEKYGDHLYLFEQRPSGDWSDADNLKNFKKFISSDELLEKIYEDNDRQVNQEAYVKYRLFDLLIGDWDRHLDQFKWGSTDTGNEKIYEPVPTDRDQAFFKFNGLFLKTAISAAGMKYFQSFDYKIDNVPELYSERRILDRLLTNKVTLTQWQTIAKNLQDLITDNVIEASIKQLPPEAFAISGNSIIAKLKSRRDHLAEYAEKYYLFLAKETEIVGSDQNEYFEVNRLNDNETAINLYKINKGGVKNNAPFYSRIFNTHETKEIRLYGLSGNDVYKINGNVNDGIRIRIIGGNQRDSIADNSNIKTHVYDDADNVFMKGSKTRLHLSKDSAIHNFYYDTYNANKKGLSPVIFYNNEDRLFVGLDYGIVHYKWRKLPFASKQNLAGHYSISQKAFSVLYNGLFPHLFGKWDLLLHADYDAIRWVNFYGLGNNSLFTTKEVDFNRVQSEETFASAGIQKLSGNSTFNISGFWQSVRIINDKDRFLVKNFASAQSPVYKPQYFTGARLGYKYVNINDSIVPTKGFAFFANASYTQNLKVSDSSFGAYSGIVQFYLPLFSKFSLSIRGVGATVSGNPLFYQLPHIGGADDLRGYRRERFWGRTVFSNSNELRFITNLRTHILNGKFGLVAFYDEGRVWMPNETSDKLHTDYGGGILLAPFNKFLVNVAYGVSDEASLIQLRIIKSF